MKIVRRSSAVQARTPGKVAVAPRVVHAEEIEVIDAIVVSEDPQSRELQNHVKDRIDVHRIVGTVVATMVLGMLLLLAAAVGAVGIMGMFGILLAEPLN
jgi:Fe2+ transport system protein B